MEEDILKYSPTVMETFGNIVFDKTKKSARKSSSPSL